MEFGLYCKDNSKIMKCFLRFSQEIQIWPPSSPVGNAQVEKCYRKPRGKHLQSLPCPRNEQLCRPNSSSSGPAQTQVQRIQPSWTKSSTTLNCMLFSMPGFVSLLKLLFFSSTYSLVCAVPTPLSLGQSCACSPLFLHGSWIAPPLTKTLGLSASANLILLYSPRDPSLFSPHSFTKWSSDSVSWGNLVSVVLLN